MDAPDGKIRFWLYDLIVAGFAVYFIAITKENLSAGPAWPIAGIWFSIGIGALLNSKFKIRGLYAFFAAFLFGLPAIPLALTGFLYAGSFTWVIPAGAVMVLVASIRFFGWFRSCFLAGWLALSLPILLTPTLMEGRFLPECHMPEAVLAAGGIVSDSEGGRDLACGFNSKEFLATRPEAGKLSLFSVGRGEIQSVDFPRDQPDLLGVGASLVFAFDSDAKKGLVLDATSLDRYQTVDLAGLACEPGAAAIDPRQIRTFLLCRNSGNLLFVDTLRGTPITDSDPIANVPFAIRFNPSFNLAYVTDLAGSTLREIEVESMKIGREIKVGFSQSDVAVSKDGKRLYVARPFAGRIQALDSQSLHEIAHMNAPYGVTRLALDENDDRIFAAAYASGLLYAVDLTDHRVQRFDLGTQIRDMVYCPESKWLLISTPCGIYFLDPEKLLNHL